MPTEIERKFLVVGTQWRAGTGKPLIQGYLQPDPHRTVRIRLAGERAFLTIKGISEGPVRAEFEYEIPTADARQLLRLCEGPLIEKVRYQVMHAGLRWEVDEFFGENAGLVLAELELESADQVFERPSWVGEEVTHDKRYFNSCLMAHPYKSWEGQRV